MPSSDTAPLEAVSERGGYRPGSPRQRALSTFLSAAILILGGLFAIYQTQVLPKLEKKRSNPLTFDIAESDADTGAKAPEKETQEKTRERNRRVPERANVETPQPVVQQPAVSDKPAFSFLKLSRADMAASDIGSMKRSGGDSASGADAAYGPGEGPGGAILYKADWFREPTDAQLGGYLPASGPAEGWGMIACQTIDRHRVENCQILGESPRGSGFGRAVLDASWQFQVIAPRINGKPQLGTWVSIRIDYGARKASG